MKRNKSFIDQKPLLYLVATPIGNLKDVTFRTLEVLNEVDLIVCEDTRVTSKLLKRYKIEKPLVFLEKHNEHKVASILIYEIVQENKKMAYVSDAGYPLISDPGAILVSIALQNEVNVSVIPGPTAFLNALVASNLDTEHFYFHGFLDAKEKVKTNELKELYKRRETLIFYESPHRILNTLKAMHDVFGARKAVIARELTKKHEEYIYFNLDEIEQLDPKTLKGEMVVLVEGYSPEIQPFLDNENICRMVNELTSLGVSAKDAIKMVAEENKLSRNYVYKVYHGN